MEKKGINWGRCNSFRYGGLSVKKKKGMRRIWRGGKETKSVTSGQKTDTIASGGLIPEKWKGKKGDSSVRGFFAFKMGGDPKYI